MQFWHCCLRSLYSAEGIFNPIRDEPKTKKFPLFAIGGSQLDLPGPVFQLAWCLSPDGGKISARCANQLSGHLFVFPPGAGLADRHPLPEEDFLCGSFNRGTWIHLVLGSPIPAAR